MPTVSIVTARLPDVSRKRAGQARDKISPSRKVATIAGGPGTVLGVAPADATEGGPVPMALVAATVNV